MKYADFPLLLKTSQWLTTPGVKCRPLSGTYTSSLLWCSPSWTFQLHPHLGLTASIQLRRPEQPCMFFLRCLCVSLLSKVFVPCLGCAWATPSCPASPSLVNISTLKYSLALLPSAKVGFLPSVLLQACMPIFTESPGVQWGRRLGLPASGQHLYGWKVIFF